LLRFDNWNKVLGEDHGLFKPSEIPEILFADGYGQPIDMEHEQAKKIKLPPHGDFQPFIIQTPLQTKSLVFLISAR